MTILLPASGRGINVWWGPGRDVYSINEETKERLRLLSFGVLLSLLLIPLSLTPLFMLMKGSIGEGANFLHWPRRFSGSLCAISLLLMFLWFFGQLLPAHMSRVFVWPVDRGVGGWKVFPRPSPLIIYIYVCNRKSYFL